MRRRRLVLLAVAALPLAALASAHAQAPAQPPTSRKPPQPGGRRSRPRSG